MRWPPWPPLCSRKFEAVVIVHKLEGTTSLVKPDEEVRSLVVEIKWKGQKGVSLRSLRRSMKRNFTRVVGLGGEGVVEWNQEFRNVCTLTGFKDNMFYPWEVMFTVSNVSLYKFMTISILLSVLIFHYNISSLFFFFSH